MNYSHFLKIIPDKIYIQLMYLYHLHTFADLKEPKTFNEKIQWLKLHDHRPEYVIMVDKYAAKEFVAGKIGSEHIIPTIGVWKNVGEIDFESLPNQFVLKWNHDSKSVVICKDKSQFDSTIAKNKLRKGEKLNGFWYGREWPYKNVPPIIIAEQYLQQDNSDNTDLIDYKFFCFNGIPKYIQVIQNRSTQETIDIFDTQWQHQDFIGLNPRATHAKKTITRPDKLEEMIEIAKKLSKDIPFARIDLYEVDGRVYFGEITFFPASGFGRFYPEKWNKIIGDMIKIP